MPVYSACGCCGVAGYSSLACWFGLVGVLAAGCSRLFLRAGCLPGRLVLSSVLGLRSFGGQRPRAFGPGLPGAAHALVGPPLVRVCCAQRRAAARAPPSLWWCLSHRGCCCGGGAVQLVPSRRPAAPVSFVVTNWYCGCCCSLVGGHLSGDCCVLGWAGWLGSGLYAVVGLLLVLLIDLEVDGGRELFWCWLGCPSARRSLWLGCRRGALQYWECWKVRLVLGSGGDVCLVASGWAWVSVLLGGGWLVDGLLWCSGGGDVTNDGDTQGFGA